MARILLITDAWQPQINGVVRALSKTVESAEALGHKVEVVHPNLFKNYPCPAYPEIRLALPHFSYVRKKIDSFKPDHIHISTEGPLGLAARIVCARSGFDFSTAFHTMFPDYAWKLAFIPTPVSWAYFRWFHRGARRIMVPTQSISDRLREKGLKHTAIWSRGINHQLFHPREKSYPNQDRPILLYVGRVSKEKNLDAFLSADAPGTKYIVGDGPYRESLEKRYPCAKFLGYKLGEELGEAHANADVFVFPSWTDTFGNVLLEALASGVPVAAYPAPGPRDIILDQRVGAINQDLSTAIQLALEKGDAEYCVKYARTFTWENATNQFLSHLVPARG